MNKALLSLALILLSPVAMANDEPNSTKSSCANWLSHEIDQLHSNKTFSLCEATENKVVLFVNTASHCGFTGQFGGLEALYQKYKDDGFMVVGFPSNDFKQEASNEEEVAKVCFYNFGVSFLMSKPVEVRGKTAHPVFQHLATETGQPKWNFYKYLVGRDGKVIDWYSSMTEPESDKIVSAIEQAL